MTNHLPAMFRPTRASVVAALLFAIATPSAIAAEYRYQFSANPGADSGRMVDPALDVAYDIVIDAGAFASFDLVALMSTSHWVDRDITVTIHGGGASALLNDAFDPASTTLRMISSPISPGSGNSFSGGVLELMPQISEFFDLDLHPWSTFVEDNALPFDPFGYGQLDAYDSQQSYRDFHALWVAGNTSMLPDSLVSSVPEPEQYLLYGVAGLLLLVRQMGRRIRGRWVADCAVVRAGPGPDSPAPQRCTQPPHTGNTCPTKQSAASLHR